MSIQLKQNDDQAIQRLRAIRSSNVVPALLDSLRGLLAFLFVAGSVVLAFLTVSSPTYAAIAAAWAALSAIAVAPWAKSRSIEAASVQELFDRHVFELGVSARARRIEPERLHELAGRHRGQRDTLLNWYPNPDRLRRPFNVLLCQRSNLFYDIKLRSRWAATLLALTCIWTVTGFVVGVVSGVSTGQFLLRWFAPSLPAFVFAIEAVRSQWETVSERQALLARVNDALASRNGTVDAVREHQLATVVEEVQDGIFATRCQTSRVPGWFYWIFRKKDNEAMHAAAREY